MEIARSASSADAVDLVADTFVSDEGTCEEDQLMCYGSQTMHPMSCGPKCYNGFIFSPSTWNVVRACRRNFYGNADAIALFRSSMMENPIEVSSYVEAFSFGRRGTPKMARVELERKFDAIEEKSEVEAQEIIEDDLTLDRTYFVSYVTFWERLSTTAANQKFDQLLEQQQRTCCEGGTEMVSYRTSGAGGEGKASRRALGWWSGQASMRPSTP
jgi:hypothetical protein